MPLDNQSINKRPVSQAQRAAMHAAAEGHSTLGIPKKVGEEYDESDPGGKLPKKKKEGGVVKRIMRAFKMNEISAVDRPAQAHAKVVLMKRAEDDGYSGDVYWKRDFTAEQRRAAAAAGHALPDGSFPIEDKDDLENARRLIGHAKDKAAALALIRRRAKALGVSLDDNDDTKKLLKQLFDDQLADASSDDLEKAIEAFSLTEHVMNEEDIKKAVEAAVKPIAEKLAAAEAALEIAKAKMSEDEKDFHDKMDGEDDRKEFRAMSAEERKKKMRKAADDAIPEHVRKQLDEAAELKKRLSALEEDKAVASFAKRATDLGLEGHGETLRKAYGGNAEAIATFESLLKGLTEQVRTGKIFAEFGANQSGQGATAKDEMDAQAAAYREGQIKLGKKCSPQQAFTAIYIDPAYADLKKRYDAEEFKKSRAA